MALNLGSALSYLLGGAGPGAAAQFGGKEFLFGKGREEVPTMTEEQKQLLNQILGSLGPGGQLGAGYGQAISNLQDLLDPSSEAQQRFADPYLQQFEQQTIPGIAERFAGGGGLASSGFGQALSAAGGGLQTQLAALKSGLQQQAGRDIMAQYSGMAGMGLGAQPFGYSQPTEGMLMPLLAALAQAGGRAAMGGFGG